MMLNKFAANNYQLVELKVPANTTSTRVYFADQPNLRNKLIEKVEWYDSSAVPFGPSGLSNDVTNRNTFITLADKSGDEFVQDMSIYEITGIRSREQNLVNNFNAPFTIVPRNIVWTKSYVSFPVSNPALGAYTILIGVYYK